MNDIAFLAATAVLLFGASFWVIRTWEFVQGISGVPVIDPLAQTPRTADLPLISVIVPAHNEEAVIERCLTSVLNQDYPRFELIFVDDRSEDRTRALAEKVCRGRADCKIISLTDLPLGWTGKCHALDAGVGHASGEWIAFLDADSALHPSALRLCHHEALRRGINMVTLSPTFLVRTFWEKAVHPTCVAMTCILFPMGRVNDPSSDVATANGMFYLISRSAYDRIGGHCGVKGLAVEDIGIGKRVKAAGLGLLFANGRWLLRTRMYTTFQEIVSGWTRILGASMNYRVGTALRYLLIHMLVSLPSFLVALWHYIPTATAIWPSGWFVLPLIFAVTSSVVSYSFWRTIGVPGRYSSMMFLGNFMLIWIFALIVKKILFRDPLQWRGTVYEANRYEPTSLEPVYEADTSISTRG